MVGLHLHDWMMFMLWTIALLASTARAELAPECEGLLPPDDYDETVQQDFLQNFPALSASLSPIHGPIPHRPGNGAIGIDLGYIPQLGCDRRTVLGYTKTEDTNKSPVLPRPRATFAFPAIELGQKRLIPYAGLGFVPPVPVGGTYNTMASAEIGGGMQFSKIQVGLRGHATLQRTVGNIAGAFEAEDPEFNDLYLSSTTGIDALFGYKMDNIVPYLSLGYTEVQSFFWIGDNNATGATVTNNQHPYSGLAISAGVDTLLAERIRLAGEFYAAPGGYTELDWVDNTLDVDQASRYGSIYTARVRIAYELRKKDS